MIDVIVKELLGAPCIKTIAGTEIAKSPIAGRGLFAMRRWHRGEVIVVLDGQEIDIAEHPEVIDALEWNALSPERLLVRAIRTSYGFINHHPTPNIRIDDDGYTMRAARLIDVGDEMTLDYFAQQPPAAYLASAEAVALQRGL